MSPARYKNRPRIQITLNPARIEEILFLTSHSLDQQLLLEVWPSIAPLVERIDRKLKKGMQGVLKELRRQDSSAA